MKPSKINFAGDPFNSDAVTEFIHVKSVGYSGSDEDLTAPAAGNFPPITLNRYFIVLPFVPDLTDLTGSRPMLIKDVTGGVALTRVTGVPGTNEYRVATAGSQTPHIIELNSGQAAHVIAYDFYAIASIADKEDFNNPEITGDLEVADDAAIGDDLSVGGDLTNTGAVIINGGLKYGLFSSPLAGAIALGRQTENKGEGEIALCKGYAGNYRGTQTTIISRSGESNTGSAPYTATQAIVGNSGLSNNCFYACKIFTLIRAMGYYEAVMICDFVLWYVDNSGVAHQIGSTINTVSEPSSSPMGAVAYTFSGNQLNINYSSPTNRTFYYTTTVIMNGAGL